MTSPATLLAPAAQALVRGLEESVVLVHAGAGHGSGVAWPHSLGWRGSLIVTNHHVAQSRRLEVEARDGLRAEARIVARDTANDLVLLWIDRVELPAAPIGDSRSLRVGELIVALGHPWGVRNTATLGIVSGLGSEMWSPRLEPVRFGPGRVSMERRELLQADVSLAPGNSGGPLADARGHVVGIACMIAAPGIALAIPSHAVQRLADAWQAASST